MGQKTNAQVEAMMKGASWTADFISQLLQIPVYADEVDPLDLHHLSTPAGRPLLQRLAIQIAGARFLEFGEYQQIETPIKDIYYELTYGDLNFASSYVRDSFRRHFRRERRRGPIVHGRLVPVRTKRPQIQHRLMNLGFTHAGAFQFLAYALAHEEELVRYEFATIISRVRYRISRQGSELEIREIGMNDLDSSYTWVMVDHPRPHVASPLV